MKLGVDCIGITVVFFCHDGKGNYLLNKRSTNCRDEHGNWDVGGGALEFGLTVEENLRKELMEEYCVVPISYEFIGHKDMFRVQNGVQTHWLALMYKVLIDPAKVKIGEPHKMEEIKWFKLDQLPQNLHSQLPAALEKYKNVL